MPRETATEEPRAAVRDVPHTPLSSSHVRVLLNALMRTPVGVVQQVGFLFMLLVAAVEASLPDCSALPTPSIAGRAARTGARRCNVVVTNEEKKWTEQIIAFAKVTRARGDRLMGEGGNVKIRLRGVPNVNVETIRRWAVRSNQKVPNILRLLQSTTEIGIDDALLMQYHAARLSPRDVGKVNEEPPCSVSWGRAVSVSKLVATLCISYMKKHALETCKYRYR